ncbi:T9SS type A sorting domain-containing protein [Hymenobacter ruricola]|uniref:T9SS type A sorting domain-containing protein n=1 Tax=Hymenobacter ruricola TaxID=2791023 RepID=A0ABS0IB98_9BACT|nr:T9SS type A sorting domain-containing protein [Hymenobacter ruricola]MBF9224031.1 T9SS type A sorting domain-containing protein [Hymenobacter ruricola]
MRNFTLIISAYIGLFILTAAAGMPSAWAQVVRQATAVTDRDRGCVAIVCGDINDSAMAVDAAPATAASISPPLALGTAALRVGFAAPVPTGARVKLLVSFTSGNALSLGLVNNTSIRTYTANGSTAKQTLNMGTVLNLTTLSDQVMPVEFTATNDFQEVEVRTGSLVAVNVGYSVQLYHVTATFTPLPVELTAFTGKARGTGVELSWHTATERNSAYFQVERAADARGDFRTLGKVAAAGSATKASDYQFVDAQPLAQGYYRLRQVDQDGTTAYSPVVAVSATPATALAAYPNPTTGLLALRGTAATGFTLLNWLGQVVQQGTFSVNEAQQLDLRAHPNGVYYLREHATGATLKVVKTAGE